MRSTLRGVIFAVLPYALTSAAYAQNPATRPDTTKKDTTARKDTAAATGFLVKPSRPLDFTTDEGTWMSVDVSPDGKTIVFDLLGDLYTMPIGGGKATRITEGPAFDAQPRFSPDGKTLAFISDRGGTDGLWLADADGKNPRLFMKGAHLSPAWSPDGKFIVASKRSKPTPGAFAGRGGPTADVMLYNRDGGTGLKIGSGTGATFGADNRYIYFSTAGPGGSLTMYDRVDGRGYNHPGGARPILSPDGTRMVSGTTLDATSALKLQDMASGDESWLTLDLPPLNTVDGSRDALPGSAFTPDGKALITSIGGKLWRIEIPGGKRTAIPFSAGVHQQMGERVQFAVSLSDSTTRIRQIDGARPSPDGKRLVFGALDKIWMQDLPTGTPRRLTHGDMDEYAPVWSPDGKYVAYVTWGPQGGDVWRVLADGGSAPEKLSRASGYFDKLAYTLDGRRLLAVRGPARERMEALAPGSEDGLELVWLPVDGGDHTVIVPLDLPASTTFVGRPFTTRDTSRVYFTTFKDGLVSMRWDGSDRKVVVKATAQNAMHAATETADDILLAPDGMHIAAIGGNTVALLPAPIPADSATTITVATPASANGPTRKIPQRGASSLGWTYDGKMVFYSAGTSFYLYDVERAESLMRDSVARAAVPAAPAGAGAAKPDSAAKKAGPAYEPVRYEVALTRSHDVPQGTVVLRGARIITMHGKEIIERGDVVVTGNRIVSVGPSGNVPADAKIIDVAGKTIIPGYIDLWARTRALTGIHASQPWDNLMQLAYGVTTIREPGAVPRDALSYADRVDAGEILGPRYFAASATFFDDDAVPNAKAAQELLGKEFHPLEPRALRQPFSADRKSRQAVLLAAKALGMNVISDGAVDLTLPVTMFQDGFPTYDRNLPLFPIGNDIVQLIVRSGATYVPSLLANDGGPMPLNWYLEHGSYHTDAKLGRFLPHVLLDQFALARPVWTQEELYPFRRYAADAARIVAAGGRVGLGTRGELPGLGAHWELWTLGAGGMPAHDALRVGTIFSAEAIGADKDLGSIEAGKLADLQILDRNPLTDLHNTTALAYVMRNGRLYEAATLTEVWPRQRALPTPWWLDRDPVVTSTTSTREK